MKRLSRAALSLSIFLLLPSMALAKKVTETISVTRAGKDIDADALRAELQRNASIFNVEVLEVTGRKKIEAVNVQVQYEDKRLSRRDVINVIRGAGFTADGAYPDLPKR